MTKLFTITYHFHVLKKKCIGAYYLPSCQSAHRPPSPLPTKNETRPIVQRCVLSVLRYALVVGAATVVVVMVVVVVVSYLPG